MPLTTLVPRKRQFVRRAERGVRRHRPGRLLDGEGLAGQGRLGDEQVRSTPGRGRRRG